MNRKRFFSALVLLLASSPAFADCPAQMTIYEDGSSCVGGQRRWYLGWGSIPPVCNFYTSMETKINRINFFSAIWPAWAPAGSFFYGPISPNMCILAPGGYQYRAWSHGMPEYSTVNSWWSSNSYPVPRTSCDHSD